MKALIIGGGIGGFATALSLYAAGIDCEVFEQSRSIRQLGVGINNGEIISALKAYDDERRSATTQIVLDNRGGGPERVIDLVEERAPDGFDIG